MIRDSWGTFMKTGDVRDYLDYRQQLAKHGTRSEDRGEECTNGTEYYPDRNGTSDDAYR